MSMNKYMHPRNIYRQPPNFKQLALDFPEYREFFKLDITGKVSLDFKDSKAVRALSMILLKKDFGLDVNIPLNKLIPTIPLRLNYILWLEDILKFIGVNENVRGIDIGTGASCIYPLLAAKKNKWYMLATETSSESITCAKDNVANNNLQSLVNIAQVDNDKLLLTVIGDEGYDFCMCNPPFFESTQELHPFFKSRKNTRPHPKNAFCADINEVVSTGGEVEFITRLANESKVLGAQIKLYSSMVGHKSNLPAIKKVLRNIEVVSFIETEFCQGNTTRWGIAWTLCDFQLNKLPDPIKEIVKSKKIKPAFTYILPVSDTSEEMLDKVVSSLMALLKDLQMIWEDVTRNKRVHRYFVSAFANTWSHQRRKRRVKSNSNNNSTSDSSREDESMEQNSKTCSDNESVSSSPGKRLHDDSLDGTFKKKLKLEADTGSKVFFKFAMAIEREDGKLVLELNNTDNIGNRDYLHQILQHIKNNLKIN